MYGSLTNRCEAATVGCALIAYAGQGERVDSIDLGSAQFNYETVALAWHPTKPILALGRSDGAVSRTLLGLVTVRC